MSVYKNEKRGTWYCIFRYKNFNAENIQKKKEGFFLKRDALAYEAEYKSKMEGGCDMLFREMADIYIADCAKRLKQSTTYEKKSHIKHILVPYFGGLKINQITPIIVRNWQNDKMIGKYKYSTMRIYSALLSSVFTFAVKFYGLTRNPVRTAGAISVAKNSVKLGPNDENENLRIWTKEQFEWFLSKIKNNSVDHTIYLILFYAGLRRGEVTALRLKDIDMEKNVIHVRQNKVVYPGHPDNIQTPKTASSVRTVTMPGKVMSEIKAYVDKLYKPEPDDLIFAVNPIAFSSKFRNAQIKMGITPRIRLHDLRHSHASLLIELGFSIQAVADRLGHANADQVIRTYGHLYPAKRDEIAEALNNL